MARPGRPKRDTTEPQPATPSQALPLEPTSDPDAVEVKAYIPRPELAEAGEDARRAGDELRHKQAQSRQRTPPERGLECKVCGSLFIQATHTTPKLGVIRRRRRCLKCGFAWYTIEAPEGHDTNSTNEPEACY